MKELLLKYIKNNHGVSIINIYDKFKNDFSTSIILSELTTLEQENKVILNPVSGYHYKYTK